MSQILLIFRKDCRRFWPEILASLALAAAFAWMYPFSWPTGHADTGLTGRAFLDRNHLRILAITLTVLLPVSWLLLIARVVHAENLTGTRQFWRTRPYTWQKLLAAKSLFVLVTVYLPLIASEDMLLLRFGFPPTEYLPNLCYNLVGLSLILILPMVALAATMSSILRIIMVLLGITAIGCVIAFFTSSTSEGTSLQLPSNGDFASISVFTALLLFAIALQFATRRVWLVRGLLLATVILVSVFIASPWDRRSLKQAFPALTRDNPSTLRVMPQADRWILRGAGPVASNIHLDLPVSFLGLKPGQGFQVENISVDLSTPDGTHWVSPWRATYNLHFTNNRLYGTLPVDLPGPIPASLRTHMVSYHISLALAEIAAGPRNLLTLQEQGSLVVAGLGTCLLPDSTAALRFKLDCRVPYHEPYLTEVVVPLTPGPCEDPAAAKAAHPLLYSWIGSLQPDLADPFLDSVRQELISFNDQLPTAAIRSPDEPTNICPGSHVLFLPYHLVRRFTYVFDFQGTPFVTPPASSQQDTLPEKAS